MAAYEMTVTTGVTFNIAMRYADVNFDHDYDTVGTQPQEVRPGPYVMDYGQRAQPGGSATRFS